MSPEELYLLIREQQKTIAALTTRLEAIEYFIKEKFPGDYAGEAYEENYTGPVVDDGLKPIELHLGPLVSDLRDPNKDVKPIMGDKNGPG